MIPNSAFILPSSFATLQRTCMMPDPKNTSANHTCKFIVLINYLYAVKNYQEDGSVALEGIPVTVVRAEWSDEAVGAPERRRCLISHCPS